MISKLLSFKFFEIPKLNSELFTTEGSVYFQNSSLDVGIPVLLNSLKFSMRISLRIALLSLIVLSKSAVILFKTFI